jgi:hypothetical protein
LRSLEWVLSSQQAATSPQLFDMKWLGHTDGNLTKPQVNGT